MRKTVIVIFILFSIIGCSPSYVGRYQSDSYLIILKRDSTFCYSAGVNAQNYNTGRWKTNDNVISFDSDIKRIEGFGLIVREGKIDSLIGTRVACRNYMNEPMETAYIFYNGDTSIKNIFVDSIFNSEVKINIDSFYVKVFNNGGYVKSEVYRSIDKSSNYFDIKLLLPIIFDQNSFECLDTINMKYHCGKLLFISDNDMSRYELKRRKCRN